ncbi:MAG: STAS domain-containing protein [bacterium]|nr:STAS domain-containing protein [bacterium]
MENSKYRFQLKKIENNEEVAFLLEEIDINSIKMVFLERWLTDEFIRKDTRDIIIDMKHVAKVDEKSVPGFARMNHEMAKNDRSFRLINTADRIVKLFTKLGLQSLLPWKQKGKRSYAR